MPSIGSELGVTEFETTFALAPYFKVDALYVVAAKVLEARSMVRTPLTTLAVAVYESEFGCETTGTIANVPALVGRSLDSEYEPPALSVPEY